MLPITQEAHPVVDWTRQTRTESLLSTKLSPPLHWQFQTTFSYPSKCSSYRLRGLRVYRILSKYRSMPFIALFLTNIYLPVPVLPTLVEFPKNRKHKY